MADALQLIAENKRTRATFLDLGNCGLTQIPAEVGELVWLESLSFASWWEEWEGQQWLLKQTPHKDAGNSITDLAPLASLTSLKNLAVGDTQVTDLSPLAGLRALQTLNVVGTKVADLAPLAGLSALQNLNAGATQVTDLAPVASLLALRSLAVISNEVVELAPLAGLSALQAVLVGRTKVTDLAPLAGLSSLQFLSGENAPFTNLAPLAGLSALHMLNFSGTQVTDLSPLAGLSALRNLNVAHTQVTDLSPLVEHIRRDLPVKWSSHSWKGSNGIYVEDCPLTNPPPEIVKQGNDAILNYFAEREVGGVDHLYEAKMLILGEGGAGKTTLLRRLYQPEKPLPTEKESTKGIAICRHEFKLKNGQTFRLNVWDFGGQEIYQATHQFFLTRRSLYLLVDDTRTNDKSVSDKGFKDWLERVEIFGGHSPTLIFQNEKSGRSKAIDFEGIKRRYDNVEKRYSGNLEYPNAADELRTAIEFYASTLQHIGDELPARWIKVRADIEARARQVPYIPLQEYFDIYGRHMEFDRAKAQHLSRYLHDLGVFLHFQDDPLLAKTVILQNEWATEAVFRILDDETVKAKLGRFNVDDCERLWRASIYADMHSELLALMQKFELCYELRDNQPQAWLATQLLPPAKPKAFADSGKPEDLVLRYRYDFLPKGIISRLTVRLHRFVHNPEMAWITGVLFERDSTTVLVELLPNGSEIELRARGPERKALVSVVAADLDALNESFQGLKEKVDKRIPCNCRVCSAESLPEFFDQKALLKRKQDNRLKVECPRSYEDVDVLELLDGIRMEKLPGWANEVPSGPSKAPPAAALRAIRIFLASSSELRKDRDDFDLYFRQRNDHLRKKGVYLEIVRWENFLDAMSETRLQDEYNKAIRNCDIFVSLFCTKTGKFTDEEFTVAHRQFKNTGRPLIYTFFKKAVVDLDSLPPEDYDSLRAFKSKLKDLGHFRTGYDDIEHLKRQFGDQLDKLLEQYDSTAGACKAGTD